MSTACDPPNGEVMGGELRAENPHTTGDRIRSKRVPRSRFSQSSTRRYLSRRCSFGVSPNPFFPPGRIRRAPTPFPPSGMIHDGRKKNRSGAAEETVASCPRRRRELATNGAEWFLEAAWLLVTCSRPSDRRDPNRIVGGLATAEHPHLTPPPSGRTPDSRRGPGRDGLRLRSRKPRGRLPLLDYGGSPMTAAATRTPAAARSFEAPDCFRCRSRSGGWERRSGRNGRPRRRLLRRPPASPRRRGRPGARCPC
mmetsp:Transcript_14855/g.34499  ORF Transcript_14855/g.34499 Transcript_14855/m.34499 type:complete len:253 (-) Transcript_14855:391-1149(-)